MAQGWKLDVARLLIRFSSHFFSQTWFFNVLILLFSWIHLSFIRKTLAESLWLIKPTVLSLFFFSLSLLLFSMIFLRFSPCLNPHLFHISLVKVISQTSPVSSHHPLRQPQTNLQRDKRLFYRENYPEKKTFIFYFSKNEQSKKIIWYWFI